MTTSTTLSGPLAVAGVIGHDPTALPPRRRRQAVAGDWPPDARWADVEDVHAVTVRLSRPLTRVEADELPQAWQDAPLSAIHLDGVALTRAHARGALEVIAQDVVLIWARAALLDAVKAVRDVHVRTLDVVLAQLAAGS